MWVATLHEIFGVVTRYNAIVMTNRQVEKMNKMSLSTEKHISYYIIRTILCRLGSNPAMFRDKLT